MIISWNFKKVIFIDFLKLKKVSEKRFEKYGILKLFILFFIKTFKIIWYGIKIY